MSMKAKLPADRVENGRMMDGEKEQTDFINVVVLRDKAPRLRNVVTVRCWMGRSRNAHTVYCSIWVRATNGKWYAGHGNAGGYGYHRTSAALQQAINSAGIKLYGSPYNRSDEAPDYSKRAFIDGVGESAMREALEAITRAAGYRGEILMTGI